MRAVQFHCAGIFTMLGRKIIDQTLKFGSMLDLFSFSFPVSKGNRIFYYEE